mgnify:FL=1
MFFNDTANTEIYSLSRKEDIRIWTGLVKDYLRGRSNLKRLCLLVDARHGFKASDHDLMDMLDEAGVAYQIILTKIDKVKRAQVDDTAQKVEKEIKTRAAAHPFLFRTSSQTGQGVPEVRALLSELALEEPLR